MNVQQTIQPWGNSAGIRLSKRVREEASLKLYQPLDISVRGNSVVLTPVKKAKKVGLKQILDGVTPDMIGGELDWSQDIGAERYE